MEKNRIIFIGSQNLGGLLDDGETMKNHMLSCALEKNIGVICRIDVRNRLQRYYYLLKLLVNLLFFRTSKIVLSSSPLPADRLLKVMKKLGWEGKNIYYWVIGGTFGSLIQEKKVEASSYRDLHNIIVEGESMKNQLESEGFTNVMVLPNMKKIDYIPKKEYNHHNPKRFVFLSRVMPQKGVDYILDASKKLKACGYANFVVDIYGRIDPSYEAAFKSKIQNADNVSYKGFLMLDNSAGYDTLASYDVMLFPTYWHGEGFPGIIIDAFIAGLPVIATDWNLNSSLIQNGYNGMIIPVHNVDALVDSMRTIISETVDIATMSRNAQNDALKYEVNNVINKDLLERIELL